MAKILLIEDEVNIAKGIILNLELVGHQVTHMTEGDTGLEQWKKGQADLLVLDLMLPNMSGEKVLEKIREVDEKFPILILSAKDAAKSKVDCFGLGTDDYLAKPFDLEEFLMRVDRLLKRASWSDQGSVNEEEKYFFGDNWVELKSFKAKGVNGEIALTEQECRLLSYFFENEGQALNRKDILKLLGYNEETSTRTIDNFIVRFRKYFELNPKEPEHFISMRSVGYLFSKKN
ncbi:response regulator transcription factor [Bacteriovorax sp. DB6_IX]|uniref:response regulator transcription factor n=1 Tax=Bacteriovorax sp. DB6_IX TaxID=1353530 RepID=UPI00038A396F|nr:response regulator transcription factor [Bacteriovorax sp. DB6_IX]EQC50782.1 response regulator receiver domain protein [Bacteriovorax sp. DB6_IX]